MVDAETCLHACSTSCFHLRTLRQLCNYVSQQSTIQLVTSWVITDNNFQQHDYHLPISSKHFVTSVEFHTTRTPLAISQIPNCVQVCNADEQHFQSAVSAIECRLGHTLQRRFSIMSHAIVSDEIQFNSISIRSISPAVPFPYAFSAYRSDVGNSLPLIGPNTAFSQAMKTNILILILILKCNSSRRCNTLSIWYIS